MIEYSFNIKSIDNYDSDVFSDMCENMIDGSNGDAFYVLEQIMDMDDKGYITIEGAWDEEMAFGDFQELDEYDIANALSFWRQDHDVYWEGTFTITKNGVSTEYDHNVSV